MTLGEFIEFSLKKNNMKVKELCDLSGLKQSYISKLLNDKLNPSPDVLKTLAKILDLKYEFLLVKAGILDEESLHHITVPDTYKAFISEVINLNHLSEGDLNYLFDSLKRNLEDQDDRIFLGELMGLILELKDKFILPIDYKEIDYSNKGIIEIKDADIEYLQSRYNSYTFSRYIDNKDDLPIVFDFDNNSYEIDSGLKYKTDTQEIVPYKEYTQFWFSPLKTLNNLYLTIKGFNPTNHSIILFKHGPLISFGIFEERLIDKLKIITITIFDYFKDINSMVFCPSFPIEEDKIKYLDFMKSYDDEYKVQVEHINATVTSINHNNIILDSINKRFEKKLSTIMYRENNQPPEFTIIGSVVSKIEKL